MRFKSKIDWWVYLLIISWVLVNIWFLISWMVNGGLASLIITISFSPFTIFLFIPMWLNTYYELTDMELKIKGGLGKGTKIAYEQIISACKTRDPTSAAALSLDRVEIKYKVKSGKFNDTVLISLKDQQEFFEQLKIRNENIEISDETKPISKSLKIFLIATLGFSGFVLIAVGITIVMGIQDPAVTISDEGIQIHGIYGITVNIDEIISITLIEKSMNEIYDGSRVMRTNGFGGMGQTNKGHFSSAEFGLHRLFVQANTAPTIHIERQTVDIFISFRDSERTSKLYRDLAAALNRHLYKGWQGWVKNYVI